MKKLFTLITLTLTTVAIHAQTANAVVFSEDGDKFTLILNGEQKNTSPQVNVKVNGLTSTYYTAKVDFENTAIADITSKNFAVEMGQEATYVIKKNKKGEYVMRFHSYAPIGSTASTPNSDSGINPETRRIAQVDDAHSTSEPQSGDVKVTQQVNTPGGNVNTDLVITETTTTTTKGKPANGENINVGMNVGGVNMGVNINVNDSGFEQNSNSTVTTTTTTRTTTSGTAPKVEPQRQPLPKEDVVVVSNSPANPCGMKMANDAFATAKKSIADKGFDDTRLTIAKQVTNANCLSVAQIKEVMGVFSFEETKLEYAKYAYDRCANRNEYYLINDAFKFTSTIDELNEYIQSK